MSSRLHLSLLASGLLSLLPIWAHAATEASEEARVETAQAVRSDVSPPLSELLRATPTRAVGPTTEIPNILLKPPRLWTAASHSGWPSSPESSRRRWATHPCLRRCSPSMVSA